MREQVERLEHDADPPPDRVDVDAAGGDLLAVDDDPAGVDRLEQVDAAQERRLAAPRRADEADDLVLGDRRGRCPRSTSRSPERLVEALDAHGGRAHRGRRSPSRRRHRRRPAARRGAASRRDQPVGEADQRDRDDEEQRAPSTRYGVKLNVADSSICAWRNTSTTPMNDDERGVLLEADEVVEQRRDRPAGPPAGRPRSAAPGAGDRPSDRAAAAWLGWIDSMPAR